ncbi:MAG: DNA polymerase III subunit alpha [Pseudomonadota bacterium]
MASDPFVPLSVFSSYTMLDGAIDPAAIAAAARKRGFPAIAITDRNGLYGSMAFADACFAAGVQPIVGAHIAVARPGASDNGAPLIDWLCLLAQDEGGYQNLCALVSAAHLDRPIEQPPHIGLERLARHGEGLIALTGAGEGALARLLADQQGDAAKAYLATLTSHMPGRVYIELARRHDPVEEAAEEALIDLAYAHDVPMVATNPACFAEPGFHKAHDVMLCIANGEYIESEDRTEGSPDAWIKSGAMMRELFADLPETIDNTLVIAQRCAFAPPKRKPILPSLAGDLEGEAKQLREDSIAGLEKRLGVYSDLSEEDRKAYFDRLDYEIGIIVNMGFPGYFLIVADFIKWAKEQSIPVGPGRGSGAGSVVAWALTITDLDPLKLGLLFERFLNPERVSMPDFDIDFCETRRGEVIRYVQEKYGKDQVAQIITFGKLKARAVLRDTGRVLQMPYGQVDRLCKLVPNHPTDPWKLDRALKGGTNKDGSSHGPVQELVDQYRLEEDVKRLFDLAMQLEGLPRHSSTHAAGVVIGDRPLDALVPLYRDPRSDMPVTQFDMKFVETAGLVKFDFLGLKTLSVLHKAVEMLARRGVMVDLDALTWDDPAVYELLQRGDTVGVFQLESEGMRRTLSAVKPTNFGDIIALVSLYRPGPMDNIPLFGRRKNGEEEIAYPHPLLEDVLKETYGIFVYQEQVMQAAQILAGYTLGGADLLRRAMGKKKQSEMDAQREIFVKGCAEHNDIAADKANELFDLIDKFAGYGFNKSHAAAYALLAYQTAWLKAHHAHEFYAASMCFDMHQTDKLAIFVDDMRKNAVACLPPCINRSEAEFSVQKGDDGLAVRYALAGLKNVGSKAMQAVIAERENAGWFEDMGDFAGRISPTLVNRRQLESLSAAGAFDQITHNRAAVHALADTVLAIAGAAEESRTSGQAALFGEDDHATQQTLKLDDSLHWSAGERMAQEKEAFGFFFSAHPVSHYEVVTSANGARPFAAVIDGLSLKEGERRPATLAVLVEGANRRQTRRGKDFVMLDLSDSSGQFSASCFEEHLVPQFVDWAKEGACVLLNVELDSNSPDQPPRATVRSAQPLDGLQTAARLKLSFETREAATLTRLAEILDRRGAGRGEVSARLIQPDLPAVEMVLGRRFRLDSELVEELGRFPGFDNISLAAIRSARPEAVS